MPNTNESTLWLATERVHPTPETRGDQGDIRWAPAKSLWWFGHTIGGLAALVWWPGWGGLAVFLVLSAVTLCAGHSVGMHRLLIHRSFATPKPLEYLLVWLGVLVGMAGPKGMIEAHDMRDWHQRQKVCPPHPSHAAGFWRDGWWQLHCRYHLHAPPRLVIEPDVANDPIYRWMEHLWWAQQGLLALVLYTLGGWAWVLWGVCLRVSVSLTGHWAVGHYAHRSGAQDWRIQGLPVQGYNLPGLGLLSFGENWHGNHHAFPQSARLGLREGQWDPGYLFIRALAALGLAWNIQLPEHAPPREGLTPV